MNFTSQLRVFRLETSVGNMARTRNVIFCFLWCLQCLLYSRSVVGIKFQQKNADVEDSVLGNVPDRECDNAVDCVVSNSVCVNNTCQCSFGYIYNGEMTSCIKVAKYGESCEESRQCSTYLYTGGSCVNNVCLCSKGYYYLHGRCNPYTGLLEKCKKNEDCYVHADFKAAFCDKGTCRCSPGFYQREYRTCRPEGKKVGDACAIDNDCRFSGTAICDGFKCALENVDNEELEFSFDTSILQQSDTNVTETGINKTCATDKDCEIFENASCGPSKTCTCNRAYFFMEEIKKCVPELGEPCQATDNVIIDYSECRNGTWTCQINMIISSDNRKCVKATRKYNFSCQMDIQCNIFGPDAICKNDGVNSGCICTENSRFIESELFCWTKRGINETCQHNMDCYVDGINNTLSCRNNVCSCPSGTHPNKNLTDCVKDAADLGARCEEDRDCVVKNAACVNETCVCKDNYYQSNSQCVPGINTTCTNNEDCTPENSECTSSRCSCKDKYVVASTGLCMPTVSFGKLCEKDVQCSAVVTGAICSDFGNSTANKTCTCTEGYHNRFNRCNKRKVLGMSCDTLGECYLDSNEYRVVCKNGECACDWGFERVKDTVCRISSKTRLHVNGATTRSLPGLLPVVLLLAKFLLFD